MPVAARHQGATVVEINPDETPVSDWARFVLRAPSGQILPRLLRATWPLEETRNESGLLGL
ncbi:MAG: hypothetical protein HYY24_02580 [Verrucomicrobia bacterium]|nr:hypothetical protein [Verrucomicrobiota bacterium]